MIDYRVKPKKWERRDEDVGILWVSLSKEETKGDKLRSAALWLDDRFNKWYVDLADVLDRHNRMGLLGMSLEQAEREAREAGIDWINNQNSSLEGLKNFNGIISFDFWMDHKDFYPVLENLFNLLETCEAYEKAVCRDTDFFLNRRFSSGLSEEKRQELRGCGVNYILEETAAGIIAAREYGGTRFYPGPQLESIRLLREENVEGAPEGYCLERYVEFNLERRKPSPRNEIPVIRKQDKKMELN